VVSLRSVQVRNEVAGRVRTVRFESGAIVEEGEALLELDDATERADLDAARASVRVAEASLEAAEVRVGLAGREVARLEGASQARAAAATELDRAKAELDSAQAERQRLAAEIDQARARVAQIEAQLEKMVLRAPFRARAGLRWVHEGQYLPEGTDVVALENVSDRIYLDFPIPQEYASRAVPGATVMAESEVLGPEPTRIEVVAADAEVNRETRNLRVRAVVENRDGRLRPGMFVQVRVPVEEPRTYTVVPVTAVRRLSYADYLFVVTPGQQPGSLRARQRAVKLGVTVGDRVIVLEGVSAGETIAATGSFKLRDGVAVVEAGASEGGLATTKDAAAP
jgi:membrane fusion protein (multidrug efflux system)